MTKLDNSTSFNLYLENLYSQVSEKHIQGMLQEEVVGGADVDQISSVVLFSFHTK